ncbi:elongation factor 1-delta-like isoform X2 [Neocloeon triangulifer]|uniref:elongation factor 1-delta-like isoform X2 n=1 Tax=Neocloeon triangulifer TaxID=2078957 RepID=UPI00286ED8CC|nr:elongation factor 1-delta-like isoform X2 [Neocloeon triangulifer]
MTSPLIYERNWADKTKYEDAERQHWEQVSKGLLPPAINQQDEKISLASEVAKARQHIKSSLECVDRLSTLATNQGGTDLVHRIVSLEKENDGLKKLVEKMQKAQDSLESRLAQLEKQASNLGGSTPAPKAAPAPAKAPAPADDDDVDLFGSSDEEDEEAQKVREQRLQEYAAKKSKKPALIAKSNLILDVKPWDDETDMKELEAAVRSIVMDGLLWGASKMVPLAYGIHKLQISAVIEDEKVSVDLLTESIEGKEDFVQSVDIAAFNKI